MQNMLALLACIEDHLVLLTPLVERGLARRRLSQNATDDDAGGETLQPYATRFDMGSNPVEFYEDRLRLVRGRLNTVLERTVRVNETEAFETDRQVRVLVQQTVGEVLPGVTDYQTMVRAVGPPVHTLHYLTRASLSFQCFLLAPCPTGRGWCRRWP